MPFQKDEYQRSFAETGFYKQLPPATRKWMKLPYYLSFQYLIHNLLIYAPHQASGIFITPVFDDCQEYSGFAEKEIYPALNKKGILGNLWISHASEYVPIQAADFLVWQYRTGMEAYLVTGEWQANRVLDRLQEHIFISQIWRFDTMEMLRQRVEKVLRGEDPDS